MNQITIQYGADNPKAGMTVAELALFLRDAITSGVPADTHVHVAIGFGAQIQKITTGPRRPL